LKKGNFQKQHHYIPITYSKNFTNTDGYIYIRDKWTGSIFPSTPQKSLKQGYLYTQPVHAKNRLDNSIENFFSSAVESDWPKIVDDISNKKAITRQQWVNLIEFILSMRVRVPNTMKAVIWLLRELAIRVSDQEAPQPPLILVEIFKKNNPNHQGPITYRTLVESGILNINVDPHRAILSFDKLIRTNESVISLPNNPTFIHNKTNIDFISSDNPVASHISSRKIEEITPYSFDSKSEAETIFPITPRTVLLINKLNKQRSAHADTFSEKTVSQINKKIALYSDRYIFSSDADSLDKFSEYDNIAPVPVFKKSTVGDGIVYKIGYKFGEPLKIRNNWKYDFENSPSIIT
jgi:hypothetical protein